MNKRKILILLSVFLLIILIIIITNVNNKKEDLKNNKELKKIVVVQDSGEIISRLKKALNECENLYETNDKKDFEIWFGIEMISSNFERGHVSIVRDWKAIDTEYIKIYDTNNNILDKLPEVLEFEKTDNIEINKNYLIRVEPSDEITTYYYIFSINENYEGSFNLVCYTTGEQKEILF